MKRPGLFKRHRQRYLEHVIQRNSYLSMPAFSRVDPRATLMDLYVPLKGLIRDIDPTTQSEFDEDFIDWETSEQRVRVIEREREERIVPLDSFVYSEPRLIILGKQGSGKTTFISHLALRTAHNCRRKPSVSFLPLRISLYDLGQHITGGSYTAISQHSPKWILDFLATYLASWNLGECQDTLVQSFEQGKCIVLFDGLDEVADYGQRVLIRETVENFIDEYPHNHYVVTSRPEAYRGRTRFGTNFKICEICAFSGKEIEQFILNWYQHVFTDASTLSARKGASALLASIQANPHYLALAVNPLLLSAITAVYNELGQLPPYRAELYERTVNILLAGWQLEGDVDQTWKERFKKQFMVRAAFWLHEKRRQTIALDEMLELLIEWVEELKLTETGRRIITSVYRPDEYSTYEAGLGELLDRIGKDDPRYSDALVLQQRLLENINRTRRYGDDDTRKAERSEVMDRLNGLVLPVLGISFNRLCSETPVTLRQEAFEGLTVTKPAEQLMESIKHCGIFIVDDAGRFSFAHRAFQEFFAATGLIERDHDVQFAVEHFHVSWWREVTLLLADLLATQSSKRAMTLAGTFFEHWKEKEHSESKRGQMPHTGLFLAGECLAIYGDRVFSDDPIYQDVAQELWRAVTSSPIHPLRLEGARLLAALHITNLKDQVLNALETEEWPVRAASAYAWGFVYHGIRTQQLERGLEKLFHLSWGDSHPHVRSCAFNSLLLMAKKPGSIGDAAIARLCAALKGGSNENMRTAANLMGSLADTSRSETMVNALGSVLTRYSEQDQAAVIWAIGQFDRAFVPESAIRVLWDIALNKRSHWLPRSEAIFALGRLGGDSLTAKYQEQLLDIAITNENRRLRSAAALTLGQLSTPRLPSPVRKRIHRELDNPDKETRINCAKVLGRLGHLSLEVAEAVDKLTNFAANPEWQKAFRLRYEAVKALGRIGFERDDLGSEYLNLFHDLSEASGEHHYVQCGATIALSRVNQGRLPVRFVAHLIEHILAMSKESELRLSAIRAIDNVRVFSLLRALRERKDLLSMLMNHTRADMESSPEVRVAAVGALGKVLEQMHSSQIVARLFETIRTDPASKVRRKALECLSNLRLDQMEQRVMDDLCSLLEDASLDYELQSTVYSILQTSFEPGIAQTSWPVTLDLSKERRTQVQFYLEQMMGLAPCEQPDITLEICGLVGMRSEAARRDVIRQFLDVLRREYQLRAKSDIDPVAGELWANESGYGATVSELCVFLEKMFMEIIGQEDQQRRYRRIGAEVPPWEPDPEEKKQISRSARKAVEKAVGNHFFVRPIPSHQAEVLKMNLGVLRGKIDAMKGRLPAIRDDPGQWISFQMDCSEALERLDYIRGCIGSPLSVIKKMATPAGLDECVKRAHREVWKEEISFEFVNNLLTEIRNTRIKIGTA